MIFLRFGVKSDKGMVREINEDSYNIIAGYSEIPVAFIIADGMGGHNSGEIASKMAVEYISNSVMNISKDFENSDIAETIKGFMEKANADVYKASQEHEDNFGMGTTLITALVYQKKMYIGHVGDSRVYLIRENRIERLTTDHSFIEELIKSGTLTREEAENHPKKNIITRALGCSEDIQVDTYIADIMSDDTFILCTDGLSNMLDDDEIMEIVKANDEPAAVCEKLVDAANKNGGEDNITVILIKND
ncbi:MAG: Stp1/IreP family PP2C-type Ser/Thr phosphatase [Clostridia bacterium]|nr:Stp1/IreP family PP2C-type Ser/Thr phosphatase [Clostridia bacterium]